GLFLLAAPTQHRGVVDDDAALPTRLHYLQHVTGHAHGAVEGHVDDLVPLGVFHLDQRLGGAQPGVVDQHIDALQLVLGEVDQRPHLGFIGHVAQFAPDLSQARVLLELFNRCGKTPLVYIADDDAAAAFLDRLERRGAANASARSSGDQYRLALEQAVAGYIFRILQVFHGYLPLASLGMPRPRSAMMLRWIWLVPP